MLYCVSVTRGDLPPYWWVAFESDVVLDMSDAVYWKVGE
jgi:hypothetical protein